MIFNKLTESIDHTDIQKLIDESVGERHTLEYKSQMYGKTDAEKKEMLKDISSMANAYGGHIIIGVKEDESNSGMPTEILGVDNAEPERDRILASCLSNVEPRLANLQVKTVDIPEKKQIIVIHISRSNRAPHMVTYKGSDKFWMRHDRQAARMSVDEIRDACSRTTSMLQDVRSLISSRKEENLKDIEQRPYYIVGAIPFPIGEDFISINDQELRSILTSPPGQRYDGWNLDFSNSNVQPHPSLYGLEIGIPEYKRLSLFRNGYIELAAHIEKDSFIQEVVNVAEKHEGGQEEDNQHQCPIMYPIAIVEYTVSFGRLLKALGEHLGLQGSFIIFAALYNIKGYGLRKYKPLAIAYKHYLEIWPRQHLETQPFEVFNISERDVLAQMISDRIWQAFHYEEAPYFNDGQFGIDY